MALALATPARPRPASRVRRKPAPQPFTLPHFRAWASDLILDTGESWHPEDFQEWMAADLFAGVAEFWGIIPEGNTKTTTWAGIGLYHAEFRPFAVVPVAAASREQAEIMYRQMEGFVLRSERLYAPMHSIIAAAKGKRKTQVPRFVCLEGYRRINHVGGGRIQVFAADDRTGDGIIPTLGLIDEPHRQKDLSLYRTWAGKLLKRDGQLAAISTRGEPGSDFEETLERIKTSAPDITRRGSFTRYASKRVVVQEWALPEDEDPSDIEAVKAANPFTGITVEMLAEKYASPTMTRHHWLRFVCNRPSREIESWLGPEGEAAWHAGTDAYELREGAPTYVGLDVALKQDTSACVLLQEREDGRFHAICRMWVPTDDRPVDVTDIMHFLRETSKRYAVQAISYDPRFFDVPAKMLADDGLSMVEVPQSVEHMTPACVSLYAGIKEGKITHGDDPAFTAHILNAVPRYNDRAFTLEKSKSHGKIDAAIALALAYDQALRQEAAAVPMFAWA